MNCSAVLILGLALAISASAAGPLTAPVIGKPAPDFAAKDISGNSVKLSDFKGKIVVIEAHDYGCIWSAKEYDSGAMQELQKQFASNEVVWLLLDPGVEYRTAAAKKQAPITAKRQWSDQKMTITDWIIDDAAQTLCKRYGVRVTPQMFVIDTGGTLAYSGAVDDAKTLVGSRLTARNYVREAVNDLLSGRKVTTPHVRPFGCMIGYPGMTSLQLMSVIPGNEFN